MNESSFQAMATHPFLDSLNHHHHHRHHHTNINQATPPPAGSLKRPGDSGIHTNPSSATETGNGTSEHAGKRPKRVPAPGAATEALARMEAAARTAAAAAPPSSTAPKRKPAPGATQEALARMAAAAAVGDVGSAPSPGGVAAVGGGGAGQVVKRKLSSGAAHEGLSHLYDDDDDGEEEERLYSNGHHHRQHSGGSLGAAGSAGVLPGIVKYAHGSVVWAKMQSYPWWPAQVQNPTPEQQRIKHSPNDQFVVFYGSADYSWLPASDIQEFDAERSDYYKKAGIKNKALQKAIDDAWAHLGRPRPDLNGVPFPG